MDIHLTWISNLKQHNYLAYSVCFKSLFEQQSHYPSVILTNDLDLEYQKKFADLGCLIVDAKYLSLPLKMDVIIRDRWLAYWQYIDPTEHEYVVITDSRDVIFQRDPIEYCRHTAPDKIVLCCEGFPHSASPFNLCDQVEAQRNISDFDMPFTDWPVMNAGVVAGPAAAMKQLCFTMWSNCIRCHAKCTDQAVFNYLCHYFREDSFSFHVADPNKDPWCVTGEAIKENLMDIEVVYQNGDLMLNESSPYFIFHQWDRTKYDEAILRKYSD